MVGENLPYNDEIPDFGAVMTVKEFEESVEDNGFTDYDGAGCPVKDGMMCNAYNISPSAMDRIPTDATHVVWFNK